MTLIKFDELKIDVSARINLFKNNSSTLFLEIDIFVSNIYQFSE